jgi:hypothetical protein
MIPTNEQSTARNYASDCLALQVDAPTASAFLVGITLIDVIHKRGGREWPGPEPEPC